jgi:3-methyladenine DNA glycosylase Mpg
MLLHGIVTLTTRLQVPYFDSDKPDRQKRDLRVGPGKLNRNLGLERPENYYMLLKKQKV